MSEGRIAVMTIDPGETTGVFAGIVDLGHATLLDCLRDIELSTQTEVRGDYFEQGLVLATMMGGFVEWAKKNKCDDYHIVIEDFVLRRQAQGGATGNLTSIWVAACAVGAYGDDSSVDWQQPSEAKGLANNDRLQMWGLYERGSGEHMRDAARHFALKVNKLLG